jgi:hypothetical protein
MQNFFKTGVYAVVLTVVLLAACERPSSPNFTIEQRSSVPIIKEITYEFLGGKGSLIDTTSSSFEDLFAVDGDGLIRIVQEIEFEIGEFDSAIPELEIDPIVIEAEIGELKVDDFDASFESEIGDIEIAAEASDPIDAEVGTFRAEFSGDGSASFNEITQLNPALFPATTPVPAGNSPNIDIVLDVDSFQSAVIESGGMQITFRNELGFQIDQLFTTLISNGNTLASEQETQNIAHNSTRTINFDFNDNDLLEVPLSIRIRVTWSNTVMQSEPGDLIVQDASDNDLIVKSATADIPQQVISPETPNIEINNPNFQFAIAKVENDPNVNRIRVSLTNNSELPLTNSTFNGLPTIELRNSDNDVIDQLQPFAISGSPGATSISSGQTGVAEFNLDGQKLTKVLSYSLNAGTAGGALLTVNSTDVLSISSTTTTLILAEANSDIDPQSGISLSDEKEVEGDFVNAQVDNGTLSISFTNDSNIPLNIDNLTFSNAVAFKAKNTGNTFASGSEIGSISNVVIPANSSIVEVIDISGKGISNRIRYDGTASSPGTAAPTSVNASDVIRTAINGSVTLLSATSILDPQDFLTDGVISIDAEEFSLTSPEHYVQIKSGLLNFTSINNQIDLDIDSLIIEFPDIRRPINNYHPDSILVIRFAGNNRVQRRSANTPAQLIVDLTNHRIYAANNEIRYFVRAYTENTRISADPERTVNNTDRLEANVEIQDLKIASARGNVTPKTIRLNSEPETGDSSLDLFNEDVVLLTDISELEELSNRISDIKFFNPNLNLSYETNVGVDTDVFAAILGVSAQGNEVYLRGSTGSPFQVTSNDTVGGFFSRGAPVSSSDLVKFRFSGAENMGSLSPLRTLSFNSDNSNVEDFLSNLPTKIRFVGKALVNPDNNIGFIVDPIDLFTNMGLDVPLNFATPTNPGVSTDTLDISLADLPDEDSDTPLKSARFILSYDNGLPLQLNIAMKFIDANGQLVTEAPLSSNPADGPYVVNAANIDPTSGFVTTSNRGVIAFNFSEDQLKTLNKTEQLILRIEFSSTNNQEVKLRATDTVKIGLSAEFSNQVRVK